MRLKGGDIGDIPTLSTDCLKTTIFKNSNHITQLLTIGIIFMEDHIPKRPDRSLLIGRKTSKWSLWGCCLI